MKTEMMLLAQFESPTVKLEDICEEYFDLSRHTAYNRAKSNALPIPTFRLSESRKAPIFVHISDLAKLIDKYQAEAQHNHIGT